jgi:hypothetical protein
MNNLKNGREEAQSIALELAKLEKGEERRRRLFRDAYDKLYYMIFAKLTAASDLQDLATLAGKKKSPLYKTDPVFAISVDFNISLTEDALDNIKKKARSEATKAFHFYIEEDRTYRKEFEEKKETLEKSYKRAWASLQSNLSQRK